jgi:hypothetical protein
LWAVKEKGNKMKLLNREPTEEMLDAGGEIGSIENPRRLRRIFQAMYNAAPEIEVDMESGARLQTENEELEHIRKALLTKNMNLVTALLSLQTQLAERDKTILEQQAQIEKYEGIVDRLLQYNGGDTSYVYLDNDLSALEAHDREVRVKCLEEVARMFRNAPSVGDGFEELYKRANELMELK